jgi:hypothetical protein
VTVKRKRRARVPARVCRDMCKNARIFGIAVDQKESEPELRGFRKSKAHAATTHLRRVRATRLSAPPSRRRPPPITHDDDDDPPPSPRDATTNGRTALKSFALRLPFLISHRTEGRTLQRKGNIDDDVFYLYLQKQKSAQSSIPLPTIRGCLEGLALMV